MVFDHDITLESLAIILLHLALWRYNTLPMHDIHTLKKNPLRSPDVVA